MPSKPKPSKADRPKRRKKKTERQLWERRLDGLVREIVLARDGFCVCPSNKHTQIMQPGHLITRGRESVRWDLYNVNCQCSGCNLMHEYYPEIYTNWFIGRFGEDRYGQMVQDSITVSKLTIDQLETLYMNLIEVQKKQERDPKYRPYITQKELVNGLGSYQVDDDPAPHPTGETVQDGTHHRWAELVDAEAVQTVS